MQAAHAAYAAATRATADPRALEAMLLDRAASRLVAASSKHRGDRPAFIAALSYNLEVWTTLAAEVADDANALPKPLRAQIFSLARFITQKTNAIFRDDEEANVDALVDINRAVARGLKGVR